MRSVGTDALKQAYKNVSPLNYHAAAIKHTPEDHPMQSVLDEQLMRTKLNHFFSGYDSSFEYSHNYAVNNLNL